MRAARLLAITLGSVLLNAPGALAFTVVPLEDDPIKELERRVENDPLVLNDPKPSETSTSTGTSTSTSTSTQAGSTSPPAGGTCNAGYIETNGSDEEIRLHCGELADPKVEMIHELESFGAVYPAFTPFAGGYMGATGGFGHFASDEMICTTPEGRAFCDAYGKPSADPERRNQARAAHLEYPVKDMNGNRIGSSQEELWVQDWTAGLSSYSSRRFAFRISAATPVVPFGTDPADAKTYAQAYDPEGRVFGNTCFQNPEISTHKCHVQINDASLVTLGGTVYMYFSIFENYRGTDYTHAIGLATREGSSSDEASNWVFRGKVLTETGLGAKLRGSTGSVLGAWSPSALLTKDEQDVDVYFHDKPGSGQYVAHLKKGYEVDWVRKINADSIGRLNLDVARNPNNGDLWILYNDSGFNVQKVEVGEEALLGGSAKIGTGSTVSTVLHKCGENLLSVNPPSGCATPTQIFLNESWQLFWYRGIDGSTAHPLCRALHPNPQGNSSTRDLTCTDRQYLDGINPVYATGLRNLNAYLSAGGPANLCRARETIRILEEMATQWDNMASSRPGVKAVCDARYSIHRANLSAIKAGIPPGPSANCDSAQ